jgi:hypothetical protein
LVQLRDILTVLLVFFMGRVRADPHPWFIAWNMISRLRI